MRMATEGWTLENHRRPSAGNAWMIGAWRRRRIYRTITSCSHLAPHRGHLLIGSALHSQYTVETNSRRIFMFEILKTTRTGRQMLRTATKTLGSASVVAALIGCAGGLGVAQTAGTLDPTFGTGGIVTTDPS